MVEEYISSLSNEFQSGVAREHAYRPAFKRFIESFGNINAVNDPTRSAYGNPDFIFLNNDNRDIILGYAETKDITANLDSFETSEQLKRYLGYSNLIVTNYLEFRFFKNGIKYQTIPLASIVDTHIQPNTDNFRFLESEIKSFFDSPPEKITNGKRLAEIMGGKALRIRENIKLYFKHEGNEKNIELEKMFDVLKKLLVHDLTIDRFADMFAQTLVYGLFVARYHDDSLDSFTRQEARDLVPPSNPFLQRFFDHIVGPQFDKRLAYIVDELCAVFGVANIRQIVLQHYNLLGEASGRDPIIHFYEDFLKEYDPVQKKEMGAFYTPTEVVQFMIKSVDEVIKTNFNLVRGLGDTTKATKEIKVQGTKSRIQTHKVQIVDPAVGTATFLNEIIKYIFEHNFKGQEGRWQNYVNEDLLPRIFGFELMMAPYTISHLKLSMTLKESGYKDFNQRLGVYLTNTLEKGLKIDPDLFGGFGLLETITEEGQAANDIKVNKPIMIVIGNPPYSGETNNKGLFEEELKPYKTEPTGGKLKEKNSKWINDDYVKFIRFAEMLVEKNGEGIISMITAHGWIENPTFRGMRFNLLNTFDTIYVLDLHGNSNRKEKTPTGGIDKNVFDIKTGVSILIAIKKTRSNKNKKAATVYKQDLYGLRKEKLDFLASNSLSSTSWIKIKPSPPNYEFAVTDDKQKKLYDNSFNVNDLFNLKNTGVVTKRDKLCIQPSREKVWEAVLDFLNNDEPSVRKKYQIPDDVRDWKYEWAKKDLLNSGPTQEKILEISYRPFDNRFFYYTGRSRGFVGWPIERITQHFFGKDNLALVTARGTKNPAPDHFFVSKFVTETKLGESSTQSYIYPLYLYGETTGKTPNFNEEVYRKITVGIEGKVLPEDILDYIYAILYSPEYREKYKVFLKRDFPQIPFPKNNDIFWKLVEKGRELRNLHLLSSSLLDDIQTTYPTPGSDVVANIKFTENKVFINEIQYFGNVPENVWDFSIGGYKPAYKWLKDRKGEKLSNTELYHYQSIIKVLTETIRIMKDIDNIPFL